MLIKNNVFLGIEYLKCMPDVCIGIAKRWTNSRTVFAKKGMHGGKKYLYAFFYDENGRFYTKRITRHEEIKLRLQGLWKKRYFVCQVCQCKFLGLIKNDKDVPDCPNCK